MKKKFTSTIAGASIFISLIGVLSRGFGFIREMIFANNFGTGTEFDLYLVGAVLPVTINTIILYVGQNFFIPGFQKVNKTDSDTVQKFYNQSFIFFVGTGLIIAIILFLLNDTIINLYMHSASVESRETASIIFNIFLLTIPFSAGISMLSALLQTVYEFKYPSISILFLNISVIVMLVLLTDKIGILVIPVGYVIGIMFQFSYLIYKSKKYFKPELVKHLKNLSAVRSVFNSALITIILIESISQLYSIFDRYFYGTISSGGIASLNYAMIIWVLPISIVSISLATVIFPKISEAIDKNSKDNVEKIYNESISINTLLFMPIAFIFFFYGDTLISIFFQRGKFIEESTLMTFSVLKYYSLSIVFYSVYSVFNKIFYSINLAKILLIITVIGVFVKLILNFILIELEQNGLALSTSISFLFFFAVSYLVLTKKLNINNKFIFLKEFVSHFLNCLICFIIITISFNILELNTIGKIISIIIFILIYIVNLYLLKHQSISVVNTLFSRFSPKYVSEV